MNEDIAERSLALLKDEQELFAKSMSFQAETLKLAMKKAPITDDGLRAAVSIACHTYDMLLCGWNSLIHGFYSVSLHSIRSIDQALITGIAVTLDAKTARQFWENKLQDVDAAKVYQRALANEDLDYSKEWGQTREKHRKNLHKFMHITETALQHSVIIADDRRSILLTLGGYFNQTRCIGTGIIYATLAFQAATNSSYALRNEIPDDKELESKLKDIVTLYKLLQDKWGKDIVKLQEELELS